MRVFKLIMITAAERRSVVFEANRQVSEMLLCLFKHALVHLLSLRIFIRKNPFVIFADAEVESVSLLLIVPLLKLLLLFKHVSLVLVITLNLLPSIEVFTFLLFAFPFTLLTQI